MKLKVMILVVITAIASSCCTTYKLTSTKYDPKKTLLKKGELLYYMPKTVLQGKVTYTVSTKTTYTNGVTSEEAPTYKIKGVEITPVLINDVSQGYVSKSTNPGFLLSENTSVKINKYGLVQSIQTDYTDKTLDVVENSLKGAANIIKTIAVAAGSDEFKSSIQAKIEFANRKLVTAIAANDEVYIKKYQAQLVGYYELLKQYYENNKTIVAQSEIAYDFMMEPVFNTPIVLNTGNAAIENLSLLISSLETVGETAITKTAQSSKIETNEVEGLVYRIPKNCSVRASVTRRAGTETFFDNVISFPQFGNLSNIPVESKRYTNKKTSIEFDPASGTLSSIHTESGSSGESISKSVLSTSELLKTTVSELKYDMKIESLKKEKELKELKESLEDKPASDVDNLQKEVDLLKLKLEIEKLKKELAELNQG